MRLLTYVYTALHFLLCGCIMYAKPNIMIILADDVGIGDINGRVETPNIDKLAQHGTSFLNAHATPLCASSQCASIR